MKIQKIISTLILSFLPIASYATPSGVKYVGELREQWKFPSDHLPIGMTLDGLHFASWNVLDAASMKWVLVKDTQGLNGSMITDEHVYLNSKLTIRDQHTARLVVEMICHPTHPRSLLSLQECSESFISELKMKIPAQFEVLFANGNAVLVDQNKFAIKSFKEVSNLFTKDQGRTFQELFLEKKDDLQQLRIVNAHLPGDPKGPARFEFAQYLLSSANTKVTTIAMGDMNFNEFEMAEALGPTSPYSLYFPYCTNISPKNGTDALRSKAIDLFISTSEKIELNPPETVLKNLDEIVLLLND